MQPQRHAAPSASCSLLSEHGASGIGCPSLCRSAARQRQGRHWRNSTPQISTQHTATGVSGTRQWLRHPSVLSVEQVGRPRRVSRQAAAATSGASFILYPPADDAATPPRAERDPPLRRQPAMQSPQPSTAHQTAATQPVNSSASITQHHDQHKQQQPQQAPQQQGPGGLSLGALQGEGTTGTDTLRLKEQRRQIRAAAGLLIPPLVLAALHTCTAFLDFVQGTSLIAVLGLFRLMEQVADSAGFGGDAAGGADGFVGGAAAGEAGSGVVDASGSGEPGSGVDLGADLGSDLPIIPPGIGEASTPSVSSAATDAFTAAVAAATGNPPDDVGLARTLVSGLLSVQNSVLEVWNAAFDIEGVLVTALVWLNDEPAGRAVITLMRAAPALWALYAAWHALAAPAWSRAREAVHGAVRRAIATLTGSDNSSADASNTAHHSTASSTVHASASMSVHKSPSPTPSTSHMAAISGPSAASPAQSHDRAAHDPHPQQASASSSQGVTVSYRQSSPDSTCIVYSSTGTETHAGAHSSNGSKDRSMGTVGHTSGSQTHQGQGEMAARGTGAVGVSKSSGVSGKESEGATGREGSASTSSAGDEKGLWDDDGPFDTAVASAASRVQAFMRAPAASPLCPAADTAMRAAIGLCAAAGCIITNESSAPLSAVLGLASTCVAMVQVLAACVYLWQALRHSAVRFFTEHRKEILTQVSVLLMLQVLLRGGIHWAEAGFNETARRAAEALVAQIATTELLAPTIATTAAAAGAGTPTAGVEAAASAIAAAAASVGSDVSLTALAVAGYFAVIGAMCVAVLWQPKYTPADTLLYCAVLAPWEALPVLAAIHLYCQYVNSVDLNEA